MKNNFDFVHPNDTLKNNFNKQYAEDVYISITERLSQNINDYNQCTDSHSMNCINILNQYLKHAQLDFAKLVDERLL